MGEPHVSFVADLHIHSKYSRATSKECDLPHLAFWARQKGIGVVATGDFTHPAWLAELKEKLQPAEPGLFRLCDDLQREVDRTLPAPGGEQTRFMLSVEISNIYKRHGRVRKVHNLVYAPDFEQAERVIASLEKIGNLLADGRPILGLDSHDLLDIVLQAGDGCYLVPAHIWTPWFSLFGAKSGFDAVEECFGDLSEHIFAVETGLSSDPAMNWQLSQLDRYRLVSNSDAHSPAKLGREANLFGTPVDYFAMRTALQTGEGYGGTLEFFPEEGKYHLDGHRKCEVRLSPEETRKAGGRCPQCGKGVTVGVLHRVTELADRPLGQAPDGHSPFESLVPLCEIIAETVGTGAGSKKVQRVYSKLVATVGPELHVLRHAPFEDIRACAGELLAEGIARMRSGRVKADAGYDGEFGRVRLFTPEELQAGQAGQVRLLFPQEPADPARDPKPGSHATEHVPLPTKPEPTVLGQTVPESAGLDQDQDRAASIVFGPLLIIAGPGTGKTRTLTHRIARLVQQHHVAPQACLAITFTRRAAEEMEQRLAALLPETAGRVAVTTFHGLGHAMLREHGQRLGLGSGFRILTPSEQQSLLAKVLEVSESKAKRLLADISKRKRSEEKAPADGELGRALVAYDKALCHHNSVDFDDLLRLAVRLLREHPGVRAEYAARYRWISIDEYQDIDAWQYQLVRLMVSSDGNVCAIGDPDQAIYGFRGSDVGFFLRFRQDFAGAQVVQLARNYRSTRTIVDASLQVVAPTSLVQDRRLLALVDDSTRITVHRARSERAEAEFVAHTIEQVIGGYSFFSVDSGRVEHGDASDFAFSDLAILYRTAAQLPPLQEALCRAGIPFQSRSHRRLTDDPQARALMDLMEAEDAGGTVPSQLLAAAEAMGSDEVRPLLEVLRPLAERHREDRAAFLAELAMGTEIDVWDPRADRVSLLTLHAAKGLEFDVVCIVGCEEGTLPLFWGSPTDEALAEERRLFFVGMTRAKRRLLLSHAEQRFHQGKRRERSPSRFLAEIEEQLLQRAAASRSTKGLPPKPGASQLQLF